ncbi:hypothetical protein [Mitsuaria sp. GD03876]|uniref:hypothetical protein n=1 Tax=Mitsuaria sp. GD03876 TaxID=2975399 RepID=UPI00244AA627|nr:hypothetical protein [Mitsuaria sp. GD03876]MDH0866643.1 hypothetical protein [Mitsuaria sp. GD03876]
MRTMPRLARGLALGLIAAAGVADVQAQPQPQPLPRSAASAASAPQAGLFDIDGLRLDMSVEDFAKRFPGGRCTEGETLSSCRRFEVPGKTLLAKGRGERLFGCDVLHVNSYFAQGRLKQVNLTIRPADFERVVAALAASVGRPGKVEAQTLFRYVVWTGQGQLLDANGAGTHTPAGQERAGIGLSWESFLRDPRARGE